MNKYHKLNVGRKITALILTIIVSLSLSINIYASSNKCGDDLYWHLSEDGVLTISGTGKMYDYEWSNGPFTPWNEKKDLIKKVVIEDGVEYIGNNAFFKCENLVDIVLPNTLIELGNAAFYMTDISKIIIPNSVNIIGWNCFSYCYNLSSVTIGDRVVDMGSHTFADCKKLTSITIPNSVKNIGGTIFTGVSLDTIYYQGTQEQWDNINKETTWDFGMQNRESLVINYIENGDSTNYASHDSNSIKVLIDGKYISFDVQPQIINGRTLVPMRKIFEELGAVVDWDNSTQTAIGTKNNTTVKITINDYNIYKNGVAISLDVPAKLINGRTLVPVRAISEAFGCKVDWDGTKSQVVIDCDELTTDNKTVDVGTIATIPNDKNSFGYYDYLNSNEAQLDIDEIRRAQELATSYRDSIGRYTSSGQYSSENIQNYAYDAAKAMNNLKNNKIIKITKNEQTLSEIIEAYLEIKSASKAIAEDPYNKMLISMGKVMIHSNLVTAIEGHKKISESILKISTGQLMEILNQSN